MKSAKQVERPFRAKCLNYFVTYDFVNRRIVFSDQSGSQHSSLMVTRLERFVLMTMKVFSASTRRQRAVIKDERDPHN